MAKIVIEIDGKDASLKIDGKEVNNLSSFSADFYRDDCGGDGRVENYIYFGYTIKNENDGEFPSSTSFKYLPASASFDKGKACVDTRHPTKGDYGRM